MKSSTIQPNEPQTSGVATIVTPSALSRQKLWSTVGESAPLGATVVPAGVNFSLFSRTASAVDLLLFDKADDVKAAHVISLDPVANRTYHYWHTFVPGLRAGQIYGYRVFGPFAPEQGLRFCPEKVLLDPYGRCVAVPDGYDRRAGKGAA